MLTERAARREAFRSYNVPTSTTNNFTRIDVHGKNENLKGPQGEPYEVIATTDVHGKSIEIQHHKHGHLFTDVEPNQVAPSHYHGSRGQHYDYRPKKEKN